MLQKIAFIFIYVLLFFFNLCAQKSTPDRPFEKIEYINLNPKWQEVCFDENFLDISDGYNRNSGIVDKVIKISDAYLYNAYLQYGLSGIYGGKLECRDIANGKILWNYSFGIKNNENVEIPKIIEIQGDKLILWTNIRRGSGTSSYGFYDMVLGKRVFDKYTGELLAFSHGDFSDNSLKDMSFDGSLFHSSVIFREKENFRYLELTSTQNLFEPILNSYLINEKGAIIRKDTASIRFMSIINIVQIHPDTLLSIEFGENALFLKFMSPQLKMYKIEKVKYDFDTSPINIWISDISFSRRKMIISNQRNELYPENFYEYYVIDFEGNMLSYHAFDGEFSEVNFPIDWTDGVVKFLGYNLEIDGLESTSTLRLFTKEGKNPKQILKEFSATDGWRFILPSEIEKLDDDYLITFRQYSLMEDTLRIEKLTLDWGATAYGYMLLDSNSLGLSSNTQENQKIVFTLSPNPTSDFVTLTYDGLALQNLILSDLSGNKVLNWTFDKNSTTIDVSHIPSGLYFVTVTDITGRKQTEKLVVHH